MMAQLTLGGLIKILSEMGLEETIEGFRNPHSYRGDYHKLAFELKEGRIRASEAAKMAESCVEKFFNGWKGGLFRMNENTKLYLADQGCNGHEFIGISISGKLIKGVEPERCILEEAFETDVEDPEWEEYWNGSRSHS